MDSSTKHWRQEGPSEAASYLDTADNPGDCRYEVVPGYITLLVPGRNGSHPAFVPSFAVFLSDSHVIRIDF
jgi:hypothetical protein